MQEQNNEKNTQGAERRPGPLDGLLIADFSRVLAGPYCTMLLGDLGATVIKVEGPAGDDTRTWMPPDRDGVATYYLAINRNKRSVVLDFNDPSDLRLVHELAARADVFIENFKPGGLKRFGLDYDAVQQRNAGIIYASISGFGTAQGASLPGYDLIVQAMSGLMSLTGSPDGPAYRSGISVFDVIAGLHAAIGILAALNHRNHTGEGQHVEAQVKASMWKSACTPRHSQEWSTKRPLMWLVVSFLVAWGTPIPACFLTSRCRQRIETLLSLPGIMGSSANSARFSTFLSCRMIPGLRTPGIAPAIARLCARCWLNGCAPEQQMSGFAD